MKYNYKIRNKMKHHKFMILLFGVLLLNSCNTDVLDIAPDGNLQFDEVLSDPDMVEGLVNTLYENIPKKGTYYTFRETAVVACSDDAWSSEDVVNEIVGNFYRNNTSAAYHPLTNHKDRDGGRVNNYWNRYWKQIRLCSQLLEVIGEAAVHTEADRSRFIAEAKVMRSFYYMELIKWFGQLPLMDETIPFDADFSELRRQSVYEIAQFIVSDCDDAMNEPNLPWRNTIPANGGRATKALASALRSEAMLFAASPLHNEGADHWEEAYQVSKSSVEKLKANGYELFTETTQPNVFGNGPAAAYRQLFAQTAIPSSSPRDRETIYQSRHDGRNMWHDAYVGSNMPGTYKCGPGPTQELVDAFETIDGQPILDLNTPYLDENHLVPNYNAANTLYDPNNPYANRDPRFEQTVLHNESTFIWNNQDVTLEAFTGGAHAPQFSSSRSFSRTSYLPIKMVSPSAHPQNQLKSAHWKFYRLGETLLNLAETAAESGHTAEALAAVNEVRARSGMPAIPAGLSQEDLVLRIHNERRVELAWEENRFFDLRRWQTPSGDLSETSKWFTAMVITKNGDGSFSYARRNISPNPRGGWESRDLLLPIPLNEASLLESVTSEKWQNPGW